MDKKSILTSILQSLKIRAACTSFSDSEIAESYDITLASGGKVADIKRYMNEIQLSLKASVANLSLITEQGLLRLDVSKSSRPILDLFRMKHQIPFDNNLNCYIGQSLIGKPVWLDIASAPHVLIAGTTGSGKSTIIHSIIANLLMKGDVGIYLFDPKEIELAAYIDCDRVLLSTEYKDITMLFEMALTEMNRRYAEIKDGKLEHPYLVLIVDEFADILSQDVDRRFYNALQLLAQKSRAANIHIILATQRPSVNVLDGSIKANFPTRIACRVASGHDSRVILDELGAERLFGKGDAILKENGRITRFQAAYTDPKTTLDHFSNLKESSSLASSSNSSHLSANSS
jgi:DNA segregation ATPase FtsK/SpoIIIE, S-DNA-T family